MKLARLFNRSHRLALALWLALLLPLAQAAAVRHEVSHLSDPQTQRQGLTAEHCGLCLAAAALGGLAPPAQCDAAVLLAPSQALAEAPAPDPLTPRALLGYRSRAPPSLTT